MSLLLYGGFLFGSVHAQNESEPIKETFAGDFSSVSVGEYWLEQVTHRGSAREKLDAEYRQGDFRVGIRYEIDQETRIDTLVLIGITKRFLEYKKDLLTLTAGNFYTTFGHGLTLRGFEEPDIYYDRDFDGLRLAAAWPKVEVTALVARPQNSATRKREGQLTGVEVTGSPLPFLSLGSSYVRSDAANTPQDPSFGLPVEELTGGSAGFNLSGISLYGEFTGRNTWGEYDPSFGWVGAKNAKGQGFYLSSTAGLAGLALSGEYKNYRNLDSPVNAPPTCNRTGRPLNYGRDERGYHVAVNGSPSVNLNLLGDYADSYTRDKSQRYSEATAEAQWQNLGVWLLEGVGTPHPRSRSPGLDPRQDRDRSRNRLHEVPRGEALCDAQWPAPSGQACLQSRRSPRILPGQRRAHLLLCPSGGRLRVVGAGQQEDTRIRE